MLEGKSLGNNAEKYKFLLEKVGLVYFDAEKNKYGKSIFVEALNFCLGEYWDSKLGSKAQFRFDKNSGKVVQITIEAEGEKGEKMEQ